MKPETTDPDEVPTALGSTEPTAEEKCHWTPEMRALAERDGVGVPVEGCGDDEDRRQV